MKMLFTIVAMTVAAMVCGCSTVLSGTSQKITANTTPTGADCSLTRDGLVIGRVNPTPGQTEVSTNRSGITVNCKKDGYQDASTVDAAGFDPVVLADVLWWPGAVVDAASGAASKYDGVVNITLQPREPSSAIPPASQPSAAATSVGPLTQ